ncbi:MRC1-like domain-containing protein [Sporodiniella umbellata]|nr:MRC1-like domain-containing protein [Sporodiniella umbellata]
MDSEDKTRHEPSSLSYTGISDSEDDFSSNFGNEKDALDDYNVSDKLKNLLRLGSFRMEDEMPTALDDESDSDSQRDRILSVPAATGSHHPYAQFPPEAPKEIASKKEEPVKKKIKKMKRREKEKGKEKKNVRASLEGLDLEDSPDEEEKRSSRKRTGRKTRKAGTSLSEMVDENGERLMRTTELLDSSEGSDEERRPLSKKELLLMYRESERNLRATELKIKPTFHLKTYDAFVQRRHQRALQKAQTEAEKTIQLDPAESDSDIEIVYDPKYLSPEEHRRKLPSMLTSSPIRNGDLYHRHFNQNLVKRIYQQTSEYKKSLEEAAKAKGQFVSASDRAQRWIEKERRAQLINQQVEQHFSRHPNGPLDFEDSGDEAYREGSDGPKEEEGQSEDEFLFEEEDRSLDTMKKTSLENTVTEPDTPPFVQKPKRRILSDSEEEEEMPVSSPEKMAESPKQRILSDSEDDIPQKANVRTAPTKTDYVMEEASEEEDEYFGLGGPDMEETEDLDHYEQDGVLVEHNEDTEKIDDGSLRAMFYEQEAESDRNMVQRLLKDITSGGLRKRKAALEEGFMFDDIDMFDDDNDLLAVRKAAAAKRRKMLQEHGGALEALGKKENIHAFIHLPLK